MNTSDARLALTLDNLADTARWKQLMSTIADRRIVAVCGQYIEKLQAAAENG